MTAQQRTRKRITESNGNSSAVPWRGVVNAITRKQGTVVSDRAVLVGISGIDASGKGYLAAKIADRLQMQGLKVVLIGADDWLNLPDVCMNRENYAEHSYEHAIRFGEMFERLIIPLKQKREISFIADCADAKATTFRKRRYECCEIDIIFEGIFLLKRLSTSLRSDRLDRLFIRSGTATSNRPRPGRFAASRNDQGF